MSVDINELDYISSVIMTEDTTTLTNKQVDNYFGFNRDKVTGDMILDSNVNNQILTDEDIDTQIEKSIQKESDENKKIITNIRKNSNTNLTDQEILDLYHDYNSDGFLLF